MRCSLCDKKVGDIRPLDIRGDGGTSLQSNSVFVGVRSTQPQREMSFAVDELLRKENRTRYGTEIHC